MLLPVSRWQVDAAVLKLHSRRCTALEFHPTKVLPRIALPISVFGAAACKQ